MTKDVGQPFGDRVVVVVATPVASITVSPVALTRRDGRRIDGDWMDGRKQGGEHWSQKQTKYRGEWDEIEMKPAIC